MADWLAPSISCFKLIKGEIPSTDSYGRSVILINISVSWISWPEVKSLKKCPLIVWKFFSLFQLCYKNFNLVDKYWASALPRLCVVKCWGHSYNQSSAPGIEGAVLRVSVKQGLWSLASYPLQVLASRYLLPPPNPLLSASCYHVGYKYSRLRSFMWLHNGHLKWSLVLFLVILLVSQQKTWLSFIQAEFWEIIDICIIEES